MTLTRLMSEVSSRFRPNYTGRTPSSSSTISRMSQASTSVDSLVLPESNQEDVSVTRLRKEIIHDFENPKLQSETSSRTSRDLSDCLERRFVDKIGMVIPGVSDREPCNIRRAHYVTMWSLGSPIEYSTSEADHGITFDDHRKLHMSLESFLYRAPKETRYTSEKEFFTTISALKTLLSEITTSWRARGIPAALSLSSVGMFAPDRLKDSYIQILHTPLHREFDFDDIEKQDLVQEDGLPFYAPYWAIPQQSILSRPWPLRPLPPHKEDLALRFPERYGADPYYRSVIQANILGETDAVTYKQYVVAKQGDANANGHMEYVQQNGYTANKLPTETPSSFSKTLQSKINRKVYEHNRVLEARRNVEIGSRLRLVRFAFTDPIWPSHNQEMQDLGLTAEVYYDTLHHIESIRQNSKSKRAFFGKKKPVEDAVPAVLDFLKVVNLLRHQQGSKVIWTIEGIPAGKGLYEISLWDQSDPLELLVQLEKHGVIEKKRFFDDLEVGEGL